MPRFSALPLLAASLLATITNPLAMQAQTLYAREAAEAGPPAPKPVRPSPMGPRPDLAPDRGVAPVFGLGLAADLVATQTYLGVTAAQQEAWRDYCLALIAFLEPGFDTPPNPETPQRLPPLRAERMAQAALKRADRAKALLLAATALRGSLDTEQLQRLTRVEGRLPPGPPPAPRPGDQQPG